MHYSRWRSRNIRWGSRAGRYKSSLCRCRMKLSPVQAEYSFLQVERSTGASLITRRSNRVSPSADRGIGQVMSSRGRVVRSRRAVGLVRAACMVVSTYCPVKVRSRTLVSAAVRVGCLNSRATSAESTINSTPRLARSRRRVECFCGQSSRLDRAYGENEHAVESPRRAV